MISRNGQGSGNKLRFTGTLIQLFPAVELYMSCKRNAGSAGKNNQTLAHVF